jgi:CheY-like chemotaxis protein
VDPPYANSRRELRDHEEADVKTVLVVDDDASVRRVAAKVLCLGGYRVIEAGSGAEALELVEEAGGRIDLLLTDVVMPTTNGRELAEALLARYPDVRVLFMSGYTEDEVILQGVRVAEVHFISKPFSVDGLRGTVGRLLKDSA